MILRLIAKLIISYGLFFGGFVYALERPEVEFGIYQFPSNAIPRIDGETVDWDEVPESYTIGTDQLIDDSGQYDQIDPKNLEVRVKVGWVKGMSRLYFLYEAYDDYWDFGQSGLKNDTFEIVVDGDLSGGPLIEKFRINHDVLSATDAYFTLHGTHAQNYHIFTPARDKSWTMLWGTQQWLKSLPYANAATVYDFRPGESGKLTLEFFITVFDHASPQGAAFSTQSVFQENQLIGLSWAIIDYDDAEKKSRAGFWNLSRSHTMYGKADELVAFRLKPIERTRGPDLRANWNFKVIDLKRRIIAFLDESEGQVTSWHWDFGDGTISTEQQPIHTYTSAGKYVVVLTVEGVSGSSRFSRVWDVAVP